MGKIHGRFKAADNQRLILFCYGFCGTTVALRNMDPDFPRPGPQDYIALLADILERLRPDIAMGSLVSSVPPRFTDALWGLLRQDDLMKGLVDCLSGRNSYQ